MARIQSKGVSQRLQELLEGLERGLEEGLIPAGIFNDPELFELEASRIFSRSWVYLAHVSEIPSPGDYVLRYILNNAFIVVRSEDGKIRAFLDMCRHRGMRVCRAEMGNASHFRCPFHGWTYRNDGSLVGVPAEREAFGEGFRKEDWGLLPIPRLEEWDGLIFGNLDPEASSLEEWLGEIRWYLELVTKRSPMGLEVLGPPQRFVVNTDWKLALETFVSDSYHTLMTHRSMIELGIAPKDAKYAMYGEQIHIPGKGHGTMVVGAPPGAKLPPFWGYPEEMMERARTSYPTRQQWEVARETRIFLVTLFPNFSLHNPIRKPDPQYPVPVPMLTFRVWHPLGPGRIEIVSWGMVERDAPEWFKEKARLSYLRFFGSSGTFEQDDTEIWSHVAQNAASTLGRKVRLNYQMGRNLKPDPNWPGPGVAYPINFTDENLRNFYRKYLDMIQG